MIAHIHAAKMLLYAQDAAETDEPWSRWQNQHPAFEIAGLWNDCPDHPQWNPAMLYRRKPRTININGIEVPEPLREAPTYQGRYWFVELSGAKIADRDVWINHSQDYARLARGMCHATQEGAELHARALLSFTEVK